MGAKMKSSMVFRVESPDRAPLFEVLASLPARRDQLRQRLPTLNATALVEDAARHGLSAMVADALAAEGAEATLSPAAWARLSADARTQIAFGLKHKRLTLAVLDALAREGVRPALLKGYGLALRLYPEQPLARPSSDVDVMVAPAELERAREAMTHLKLTEQKDHSLEDVFEEHHHVSFARPGALVEVHFRLFSGFGGNVFDDAALRGRFRTAECEGRPVLQLAPEDEFLYLATHAANHSFLRISWLVDLQRYLKREPHLDWARMGHDAKTAGFSSAVAASLWLLESAMGVELPAPASEAFELRRWRRLGHSRLFSPARVEAAAWSSHRLWGFALRLWLVDSPRAGVRHAIDGALRFARKLRAHP